MRNVTYVFSCADVPFLFGFNQHRAKQLLQVLEGESTIKIPELKSDGVLWLETEAGGLLSEAAAVVLCRDKNVVEDLQKMEESALLRQMPNGELENLLVDIGMVLQYVAATDENPDAGKSSFLGGRKLYQKACFCIWLEVFDCKVIRDCTKPRVLIMRDFSIAHQV